MSLFLIITSTFLLIIATILFKNLPNMKERLKFGIPILLAIAIGYYCYSNNLSPPTMKIGRYF